MHELHQLKDKLIDEMKKYSNKDMTVGTLDIVDKLAHAAKNVCKVIDDMDYSERGAYGMAYDGGMHGGSYDYGRYADARGRTGNVKRDSMGRYSRTGELAAELRGLMGEVRDQNTRAEFERLIEKVERL